MSRTEIGSGILSGGPVNPDDVTSPTTRLGVVTVLGLLTVFTPQLGIGLPSSLLLLGIAIVVAAIVWSEQQLSPYFDRDLGVFALLLGLIALGIIRESVAVNIEGLVISIGVLIGCLLLWTGLAHRFSSEFLVWIGTILVGSIGGIVFHEGYTAIVPEPFGLEMKLLIFASISGAMIASITMHQVGKFSISTHFIAVGIFVFVFVGLGVDTTWIWILITALGMMAFGLLAYAIGVGSIQGTGAGVFFGFVTLVFGGIAWFTILFTFVVGGALVTKYRYRQKARRGVAEADHGTRGIANVFGNGSIAFIAVIGYRAATEFFPGISNIFMVIFAAAMATALADTISSEIGVLYDNPRLITTLNTVPVGTNGGVTWQGAVTGTFGSLCVAILAVIAFHQIDVQIGAILLLAGIVGMMADSILGATLEGDAIGNQGVNLLATLVGSIFAVGAGLGFGLFG